MNCIAQPSTRHAAAVICFLTLTTLASQLSADVGQPLAVRKWPGNALSIETQWGLKLVIDARGQGPASPISDTGHVISPNEVLDHFLIRQPNEAKPVWVSADQAGQVGRNAIHVETITQLGPGSVLLVTVDDVRVLYVPNPWFEPTENRAAITAKTQRIVNPELLILDSSDPRPLGDPNTQRLLKIVHPDRVLLNRIDAEDSAVVAAIQDQVGAERFVRHGDRNTIAVAHTSTGDEIDFLVIGEKPWQMPNELEQLFVAMERSNQASQEVFAKLSVNQLNFKPANGTHTPRWNVEHMMGRQLLFFSQIYHQIDPTIPVIDLNPKQMPPDYVFAHPQWDGAEEARQMERVNQFTRRFAYLLAGMDLDEKAPGSRWTLRGLLKQMDRHYHEHTANTVKKFELPGWPAK